MGLENLGAAERRFDRAALDRVKVSHDECGRAVGPARSGNNQSLADSAVALVGYLGYEEICTSSRSLTTFVLRVNDICSVFCSYVCPTTQNSF